MYSKAQHTSKYLLYCINRALFSKTRNCQIKAGFHKNIQKHFCWMVAICLTVSTFYPQPQEG